MLRSRWRRVPGCRRTIQHSISVSVSPPGQRTHLGAGQRRTQLPFFTVSGRASILTARQIDENICSCWQIIIEIVDLLGGCVPKEDSQEERKLFWNFLTLHVSLFTSAVTSLKARNIHKVCNQKGHLDNCLAYQQRRNNSDWHSSTKLSQCNQDYDLSRDCGAPF